MAHKVTSLPLPGPLNPTPSAVPLRTKIIKFYLVHKLHVVSSSIKQNRVGYIVDPETCRKSNFRQTIRHLQEIQQHTDFYA